MTLKITILGAGSAYGVPFVGGCWGDCDPGNPKNRRTTASILIERDGTKIMVDMGPDFREQAEKHNITLLDGILYTHPHADHIVGNFHLPKLMYYYHDRNLPLYATRATRKEIEKVWWFQNDPAINVEYSGPGRPYWCEIVPYSTIKIGALDIMPLPQHHGRMESLGFRIGNFAYCTDFNDMPERSFDMLQGLDVWILECNSETPTTMHLHLEKALALVEKYAPKQAYLTHLDYTMDYAAITAKLPPNVALCYDGMVLEV